MLDLTNDFQVFVATLSGEFDNQPLRAKQAGACVILNRQKLAHTRPKQFGDGTIRGVCLAPEQFSCWLPEPIGCKARIMNLNLLTPYPALKDCMVVAQDALDGKLQDFTGGATFYYVPENRPHWANPPASLVGEWGTSLFYKNA